MFASHERKLSTKNAVSSKNKTAAKTRHASKEKPLPEATTIARDRSPQKEFRQALHGALEEKEIIVDILKKEEPLVPRVGAGEISIKCDQKVMVVISEKEEDGKGAVDLSKIVMAAIATGVIAEEAEKFGKKVLAPNFGGIPYVSDQKRFIFAQCSTISGKVRELSKTLTRAAITVSNCAHIDKFQNPKSCTNEQLKQYKKERKSLQNYIQTSLTEARDGVRNSNHEGYEYLYNLGECLVYSGALPEAIAEVHKVHLIEPTSTSKATETLYGICGELKFYSDVPWGLQSSLYKMEDAINAMSVIRTTSRKAGERTGDSQELDSNELYDAATLNKQGRYQKKKGVSYEKRLVNLIEAVRMNKDIGEYAGERSIKAKNIAKLSHNGQVAPKEDAHQEEQWSMLESIPSERSEVQDPRMLEAQNFGSKKYMETEAERMFARRAIEMEYMYQNAGIPVSKAGNGRRAETEEIQEPRILGLGWKGEAHLPIQWETHSNGSVFKRAERSLARPERSKAPTANGLDISRDMSQGKPQRQTKPSTFQLNNLAKDSIKLTHHS